jgi:hypothetical protein
MDFHRANQRRDSDPQQNGPRQLDRR